MALMGLVLASCTAQQNGAQSSTETDGEPRRGKLSTNFSLEELRELAEKSDDGTVGSVEVSGIQTLKKDFKQINNKMMLFDETIRDEDERFERLENAVQGIHNELSEFKPGINRLLAIETDIKELHSKLSQLVQQGNMDINTPGGASDVSAVDTSAPRRLSLSQGRSSPSVSTPQPDESAEEEPLPNDNVKPDAKAEEVIATQQQIQRDIEENGGMPVTIRAWQSADKTRIVFEIPRKADYSINYDEQAGQVSIQTDQKFSPSQAEALMTTSNQIVGATAAVNQNTDMSTLSLDVDGVSSISKGYYLSPQNDTQAHRYYFDIYR